MDQEIGSFKRFLADEQGFSPHTVRNYLSDLRQFFSFLQQKGAEKNRDPLAADGKTIRGFLAHLHALKLKKSTMARKLATVRTYYQFLLKQGTIRSNPGRLVATPRQEKTLPKVLSKEEAVHLVQIPSGDSVGQLRDHAILETFYASGLRAGELVGLDALGTGKHRCEAIALTTAHVCEVPFQDLASVAAQLPSLQQQLLRVIGQSADRDQDHLEMLVRRQANERIGLFLHGPSERLRRLGESGSQFKLPMSREDIARFLGLAVETVSRGFTRLQEEGVISVLGRRLEILDHGELNRLAHGDDGRQPGHERAQQ